jgi:hypothetical protein
MASTWKEMKEAPDVSFICRICSRVASSMAEDSLSGCSACSCHLQAYECGSNKEAHPAPYTFELPPSRLSEAVTWPQQIYVTCEVWTGDDVGQVPSAHVPLKRG